MVMKMIMNMGPRDLKGMNFPEVGICDVFTSYCPADGGLEMNWATLEPHQSQQVFLRTTAHQIAMNKRP